jgi:UDP-glucose 4-epimerase
LDWKGSNVLVTGGAGFIGSHVADRLIDAGAKVTIFDNLATGFREFVNPKATFVQADLLDQKAVDDAAAGKDFVFHLAANADIKEGLSHPRRDVEQNVIATQNVLEAMRKHGVKRIAFSSTGSVYGEHDVIPTPEDAPFPVQTSLYATSKVAAEGLLTSYAWGYGFRVYIYRFVSMLGPRYTHGHVFDFWKKLKKDPTRMEVLGNGHQLKSYLHVSDCVTAILTGIEKSKDDKITILNIGHDGWIEVNESIKIICRELKVTPELTYTGGVRGWVGDSPKILLKTDRLKALGWKPTRTIEESIVDTLRFLVENPYCDRRG